MDWIKLKKRPLTEEEKAFYAEHSDDEPEYIFDCPLPEDGQEVIFSQGKWVGMDVFCRDGDNCYFDCVDIDAVSAWMPKPAPFKENEGTEDEE